MSLEEFFAPDEGAATPPPPPEPPSDVESPPGDGTWGSDPQVASRIKARETSPDPDPPKKAAAAPEPDPEPADEPAAAPDPEDLSARLAKLEEERERLEKRLSDTQRWGNDNNTARLASQAAIEVFRQQEDLRRQAAERARALAFPEPPDPDELLSDPKALVGWSRETSEWGYRRALAELGPMVAESQALSQGLSHIMPALGSMMSNEAARMAVAEGLVPDLASYNEIAADVSGRTQAYARAHPDQWFAPLRPDVLLAVARQVVTERGKPVAKSAKPAAEVTAGKGDPAAPKTTAKPGGSANGKVKLHPILSQVQDKMNIKLSPGAVRAWTEKHAASLR